MQYNLNKDFIMNYLTASFRLLAAIALSLNAQGCGKSSSGSSPVTEKTLDGKTYIVSDSGTLTSTPEELTGTGSVIFKEPVGEIGSNKNYALTFTVEEGHSLQLLSHSSNKLAGGVFVKLNRDAAKLSLTLSAGGKETAPKVLEGIDASAEISLWIDIHNSEDPAHILIWKEGQDDPTEDNAIYNSDADGATPGKGSDGFYGLILNKATVKNLSVKEPKFAD